MEAFTDPAVLELWVMKSAQVGWTTLLENFAGYHIHQDPAPILLVQPTLDLAKTFSKDRLAPMLRDTPVLHGKVRNSRSRDSDNTLLHKSFDGGHITLAGANAPSGLRARPIRILLLDEIDGYPRSAGKEGSPIALSGKRQTAFWNRRRAGGSTPTRKGQSEIEDRFESSDQRFFFVPCQDCGEPQRLVWAQVKWNANEPYTARYACQHCGVLWNDTQRWGGIQVGAWRASKPFRGIAGFHISEIYSPFVRLEEMARNFLEAKKRPETLQAFVNTSLAETWEESGEKVEPEGLLARVEPYGPESVPGGALLLTVGIDVQVDRVECQLIGWGADEESWVLEQHVIRGDPGTTGLWIDVDDYIKRKYRTEDGRTLYVEAAAVDSGGHYTQAVYHYCARRKRYRIWAVKGAAGPGRLVWPKRATKVSTIRTDLFIVGVDTVKSVFYGRLKLEAGKAGYIHLPNGVDAEFCKQFASETAVSKFVEGRRVTVFRPLSAGIKQEAQDCWIYGYAAMVGRGGLALLTRRAVARGAPSTPPPPPDPDAAKVEEPVPAAEQEQGTTPSADPTAPAPVQPKRRVQRLPRPGFVKRWRW